MSSFAFSVPTWTPTAVADGANFTDAGYCAVQGGTATQLNSIRQVYIGGLATSSAPTIFLLARDSVVGATLTALSSPNSLGLKNASAAAPTTTPIGFVASTTKPQRSATVTLPKVVLNFNPFGGICKWFPPDSQAFDILGNTASLGEASLSAFTGTVGLVGSTIEFETA